MTIDNSFQHYQRHCFIWLFTTLLVITITISFGVYHARVNSLFQETRETLKQIAVKVAAHIPVATHEKLINPEQQENDDYHLIESYFQSVMDGNPKIDDIYTLRPTNNQHEMIFVVSAEETRDKNGNNLIEEFEQKAMLGEEYNTADFPELEKGLIEPAADKKVTYDKWGAWISGYAPLTDKNGKAVALVGVDEAASFIAKQNSEIRNTLLVIDLILLPFLILIAYLLSKKLIRPLKILVEGMKRVAHGDFEHQLTLKGKKDEIAFIQLFNNMISMFKSARKHELENENNEQEVR